MEQIELFKEKNAVQPVSEEKKDKPKVKKPGSKYYEPNSDEEKDEYVQKIYGENKAWIEENIVKAKKKAEENWPK